MSSEKRVVGVEEVKEAVLEAMIRGLNVTANAVHIRDLAEAYALLSEGLPRGGARGAVPRASNSPLTKG